MKAIRLFLLYFCFILMMKFTPIKLDNTLIKKEIQILSNNFTIESLQNLFTSIYKEKKTFSEANKTQIIQILTTNSKGIGNKYTAYFKKKLDKMLSKSSKVILSTKEKKDGSKQNEILKKMLNKVKVDNTLDTIIIKNLEALLNLYLIKEQKTMKIPLLVPNYFIFFSLEDRLQNLGVKLEEDSKQTSKGNQIKEINKASQTSKQMFNNKQNQQINNQNILHSTAITAKLKQRRISKKKRSGSQTRASIDHGHLLPEIQDQPCGNCWAVSSAEILTAYIRQTVDINFDDIISPQLIMDCVNGGRYTFSNGCDGGNIFEVAEWLTLLKSEKDKGLHGLKTYPYSQKSLDYSSQRKQGTRNIITSFPDECKKKLKSGDIKLPENTISRQHKNIDNDKLYELLTIRPVAVAIRTLSRVQFYDILFFAIEEEIILNDEICSAKSIGTNHIVALYAYRNDISGKKYWEARNSYGTDNFLYFTYKFSASEDKDEGACGLRTKVISIDVQDLKEIQEIEDKNEMKKQEVKNKFDLNPEDTKVTNRSLFLKKINFDD